MLKDGRPSLAVTHFIDRQAIGMIETRGRLRFAAETCHHFAGIRVINQHAFPATIRLE